MKEKGVVNLADPAAFDGSNPIRKFVHLVLLTAIQEGATEIHFEPREKDYKLSYLVGDNHRDLSPPPADWALRISNVVRLMADLDIMNRKTVLHSRFPVKVGDVELQVGVLIRPQQFGDVIGLRLFYPESDGGEEEPVTGEAGEQDAEEPAQAATEEAEERQTDEEEVAAPRRSHEAPPTPLARYLKFAAQSGASDLHFSINREITVRLHGTLRKIQGPVLTAEHNEVMLREILTPEQREVLDRKKSVDFCYDLPGVGRFRANVYRQRLGLCGAFRVLPHKVPTLADLGMPPVIERLLSYRQGLVLVTGPAGCGKTTTLAAMINHINETRHEHIITVEDPIEIIHTNKKCTVTQREVRSHTQSFATALRAALREDPDVILIGEMRDLETISIAVTSAETGHLVLGTLSTPGAARTVNRLVDVFPPEQVSQVRAMVSESLRGIVSQELVPRADGKGRVAALEIMVCTPPIANMIRENRTFQIPSMMQIGIKQGMRLMETSLQELVQKGLITAEEASHHVENPVEFTKGPGKAGAPGEAANQGGRGRGADEAEEGDHG